MPLLLQLLLFHFLLLLPLLLPFAPTFTSLVAATAPAVCQICLWEPSATTKRAVCQIERERLHSCASGAIFCIALISEQPIPEEPPVMMITENRLKYSNCFMILHLFTDWFFYAHLYRAAGLICSVNWNHQKRKNTFGFEDRATKYVKKTIGFTDWAIKHVKHKHWFCSKTSPGYRRATAEPRIWSLALT